jgi:pyrroline-5-carboxylate reductase
MKSHFGIVGPGKLAQALLAGWIEKKILKPSDVWALTKTSSTATKVTADFQIQASTEAQELPIADTSEILLAVKPKQLTEAMAALTAAGLREDTLILSVLAGTNAELIESAIHHKNPVIVFMTNTGARVGEAMTALIPGHYAKKEHLERAQSLAEASGAFMFAQHQDFHNITAAAGSGIAFAYKLMGLYAEVVRDFGLHEEDARKIAVQIFLGAAKMAASSPKSFPDLIAEVATPGGCTERGLSVLSQQNWRDLLEEVLKETSQKASALAK